MDNSIQRVAQIKAALLQTTNTAGWAHVKSFANSVVQKTVQEALDENDPVLGEAKRLKASAIQKGFASLFQAIETTKGIDTDAWDDVGLGDMNNEQ